jgi:hypothetical protein
MELPPATVLFHLDVVSGISDTEQVPISYIAQHSAVSASSFRWVGETDLCESSQCWTGVSRSLF